MREKIIEIINKISDQRPYKKAGDADSYSDYNQGWSDACGVIESEIESLKPSQSAEEFLKKYYPEQLIYSNMDFLVLMLEQYASQAQGEDNQKKTESIMDVLNSYSEDGVIDEMKFNSVKNDLINLFNAGLLAQGESEKGCPFDEPNCFNPDKTK